MADALDPIRRAFDQRAAHYDDSAMHRALAAAVAESLDLDGVETVVDIATGTGLVLRALDRSRAAAGTRLVGTDISPGMLRVARRELPSAEWVEADAAHLPVADSSVDIVTCVTALHIIPDVPAALREWARVLKPGGRLITASFTSPHLGATTQPSSTRPYPRDHEPYASVESITTTFEPHGFELDAHTSWSDATDSVLIARFAAVGR